MTKDPVIISVISTKPPFSSLLAKEALHIALASASNGFYTQLLLMGDGIYQLLNHQETNEDLARKSLLPLFHSLVFYNINTIYVDELSLKEKNIPISNIDPTLHITQTNSLLISELLDNSSHIYTF